MIDIPGPLPEPIKKALESEDIPKLYANGFGIFFTNSDIGIVLNRNNQPIGLLNVSLTLAKTLIEKLGQMVYDFEKSTDIKILTTNDIEEKFLKKKKDNDKLQ